MTRSAVLLVGGMFDYDVLNEGAIYIGTTVNIDQSGTNVYKDALKNKVTEQPLFSSYYLEKGNFLKIDNETLGYTFNFKNNKYVRNLRIYGNVTNLATITGYSVRSVQEVNAVAPSNNEIAHIFFKAFIVLS